MGCGGLALCFYEFFCFKFREEGVGIGVAFVELGHVDAIGAGEEEPVEISAPDDKGLLGAFALLQGVVHVVAKVDAGGLEVPSAGENDILSAGQDAANGFVGFSTHDDRMAHGEFLEAFKILRQMPEQFIVFADGAIVGHGDDDGKFSFQRSMFSVKDIKIIITSRDNG